MITYFSENPENDLWREILQYTYEANIIRYSKKHGKEINADTIACITGSLLQAFEYYKSAKEANLQIAPLLLYYGSTNLLYGMANLIKGEINHIENHGMKIFIPDEMKFIADTNIRFLSHETGGVHVIARILDFNEDLTGFGDWELRDFLDSIAEINREYNTCYDNHNSRIAMLEVINTPEGKVEKVYYNEENKQYTQQLLGDVTGFSKSYLHPVDSKNFSNNTYFILRHKLNGKDISEISYSGQPFLRASHVKKSKIITLPTILNMYITLFALASLCRYYPEKWSPFVLKDTTGERLLIEKFLFYARRIIPNIVLNKIVENDVQYTSKKYEPTDTIKLVGEHQVQEMVRKELNARMEKEALQYSKIMFNDGGEK